MPDNEENGSDSELEITEAEAQALLADAVKADAPDTGADDLAARITGLERDLAKWRDLAKKHEGRAKQNAAAATEAKTLQQQIDDLRGELTTERESQVERNGKLALAQVHTRLAEGGIARADVAGLLEHVDLKALLADGQPDDKAIEKFASSLLKVAGRASPDPDQGRKGGGGPVDMNTLIRRAAGVIT